MSEANSKVDSKRRLAELICQRLKIHSESFWSIKKFWKCENLNEFWGLMCHWSDNFDLKWPNFDLGWPRINQILRMQLNGFHSILIIRNGILFDIRIGRFNQFESGRCVIEMISQSICRNIVGNFHNFKITSATFGTGLFRTSRSQFFSDWQMWKKFMREMNLQHWK